MRTNRPHSRPSLGAVQVEGLFDAHLQKPQGNTQQQPLIKSKTRPKSVEELGRLVQVTPTSDGQSLDLVFEHHTFSDVSHIWSRDACPCAHCVSESSGQKNFATCDIGTSPQLQSSKILEDGSLQLVWARDFMGGDSHTSNFPLLLLQRLLVYGSLPEIFLPERYLWDRAAFEKDMEARTISYDAWMAGGESFAQSLLDLSQWGLILVKGVPETREAVKDITNKIGNLQATFYGETWDVISKPNAENVAYTNEFLCLHQDLMYNFDVPYIQLLHCMKNDCQGGDSLFSDGLRAAAELKHREPDAYMSLRTRSVNFQYSRNGHFYRHSRRVISHAEKPQLLASAIHWSPPFQGPFYGVSDLDKWHKAAKAFKDSLEAPENMLQYRLQPGDCVLFDNSRILHGRTRFDTSSGLRHLHGTYLSKQSFLSAIRREIEQGHISGVQYNYLARLAEAEQAITWYGEAVEKGGEKYTA
ncbi:hypothetical protein N0V93_006002 [Gnomoniopsis smithogilvyi]|uniref:Gamma-butyrobetaine dioxygenase n=1 Tax=Gnomoniopsis smithogilvyi TaxID=1191159 RepID=A0A9W8YNJ5_9PEZI|nr:hypothetical protein N0V93_006002 [Gnomoniopsis smithogilvyi]